MKIFLILTILLLSFTSIYSVDLSTQIKNFKLMSVKNGQLPFFQTSSVVNNNIIRSKSFSFSNKSNKYMDIMEKYLTSYSKVVVFEENIKNKNLTTKEEKKYNILRDNSEFYLNSILNSIRKDKDIILLDEVVSLRSAKGNLIALEPIIDYIINYTDLEFNSNNTEILDKAKMYDKYIKLKNDVIVLKKKLEDPELREYYYVHHEENALFDNTLNLEDNNLKGYFVEDNYKDDFNEKILNAPITTTKSNNLSTQIVYEKIMENFEFIDDKAMTIDEIQEFLEKKDSCLRKKYRDNYPSKLIYNACKKENISPKVMLATLQKEQSLISRKTITEHKMDWALGVGCPDGGYHNPKYKGFERQVQGAAHIFKRWYKDGFEKNISQNGYTMKLNYGKKRLKVKNENTYSFYKYTPHTEACKLFSKIYISYFSGFLKEPVVYPSNNTDNTTTNDTNDDNYNNDSNTNNDNTNYDSNDDTDYDDNDTNYDDNSGNDTSPSNNVNYLSVTDFIDHIVDIISQVISIDWGTIFNKKVGLRLLK